MVKVGSFEMVLYGQDDFMSSQRGVEHTALTYMTINALVVRHLYMDFPVIIL